MDQEELAHIQELLQIYNKRLRQLEKQAAASGIHTDPQILNEIEDIRVKVGDLNEQSNSPGTVKNSNSTRVAQPLFPKEYNYSIAERYLKLPPKQRHILSFMEYRSRGKRWIEQEIIEVEYSRQYTKSEVYYRLEQLYLLGFLDKQEEGQDTNNRPRFSYSLTQIYKKERSS